jgi:molybdenum cofactor biosynthesis enzyme MoaA
VHPLVDRWGRVATVFRAHLTDHRNVRCTDCMPVEGPDWPPHENQLSDEEDCDRVRLTADGQVRDDLFARTESDLRVAMRSGATDADLVARWLAALRGKAAVHGIDDPTFVQPDRSMSAIGG